MKKRLLAVVVVAVMIMTQGLMVSAATYDKEDGAKIFEFPILEEYTTINDVLTPQEDEDIYWCRLYPTGDGNTVELDFQYTPHIPAFWENELALAVLDPEENIIIYSVKTHASVSFPVNGNEYFNVMIFHSTGMHNAPFSLRFKMMTAGNNDTPID